jgi:hypothetical protein
MKLTIFAALLMMSLAAFANPVATGENPGGNVTGPDCEGSVADSSGTKDTAPKPADAPAPAGGAKPVN